jgi:hypothetical protein
MPISTPDWSALASEHERLADSVMAGGTAMTTAVATATAPLAPAAGLPAHGASTERREDRPELHLDSSAGHRRGLGRFPHRRG